jgi:deferrochelatase/peroxidase EfeB/predicted acylesterase/phospholipase RssA
MSRALDEAMLDTQVQALALTGSNAQCMRTLLLAVTSPGHARDFLAGLLRARLLAFGRSGRPAGGQSCAISIGFTFQGLQALGVPAQVLAALRDKSPAFAEGAALRAARCLGDAGESAAERWDAAFDARHAHIWIAIHGPGPAELEAAVATLRQLRGAAEGLSGWEPRRDLPDGGQLRDPNDRKARRVHFGLRDNITRPSILGPHRSVPRPDVDSASRPRPGELLLGYPDNDGADLWTAEGTPDDVAGFLRNGSFGVLRKIEQHVDRFEAYLRAQADRLRADGHPFATATYLKAKLCGRWPNGAPVLPGETEEPPSPGAERIARVDFRRDDQGRGCPFGAHIRRANPRTDPLMPSRERTLFRRGIPYGRPGDEEVGLLGLFFCARIEDQFEHLVGQWLENNPMGPPNRGRAKDPLSGNHDEPQAQFHIPLPDGRVIALEGFEPFVRTRGTLYALFPSLHALEAIAWGAQTLVAAQVGSAARPARVHATRPADEPGPTAMDVPHDRFCDIVMEGGITSGIIYASAVSELARHYRFVNIGGSSIGAFAAALAAAAEYRRRHGSADGFEALAKLPEVLAQAEDGRTRLERLFIPQPATLRLFRIFLATLERGRARSILVAGTLAALRQYRRLAAAWTALLLAVVLAGPVVLAQQCWMARGAQCVWGAAAWVPALLLTLVAGVLSALVGGVCWDLARGVVRNGFGLCRGWAADSHADSEDLAGFLHASLQKVAGRDVQDAPLTFRDLWDAPGSAADALGLQPHGDPRSINLEVYASNLAHGRPYRFPLDEAEDMGRLLFRVEELERYFPKGIVQFLAAVSDPYVGRSEAEPAAAQVEPGYLQLPVADLPIVVAARLSMSFPLLLSAVPLHAVVHGPRPRIARCWMSDGGLCSNFPIHLFDSFLPKWPTFGISLAARDADHPRAVWLPEFHGSGRADTWDHAAEAPHGRLFGFLAGLWRTTWHWNDSTMMRMPGVRDRVVRLYLQEGEGGVNIRMPATRIRLLGAIYGKPAAHAFIAKFLAPESRGWQEHRWVRLNCLLISMRERMCNFGKAADLDRYTLRIDSQLDAALCSPPLSRPEGRGRVQPSETALDDTQVRQLRALVLALRDLDGAFVEASQPDPYRAIPKSSLRIRHPT